MRTRAIQFSALSLASTGTEATERAYRLAACYRAGVPHRVDQGMVALGIDSCAAHREMHLPPTTVLQLDDGVGIRRVSDAKTWVGLLSRGSNFAVYSGGRHIFLWY